MENKMQFEREQFEKLSAAASFEEAMTLVKELGLEPDEEMIARAKAYFEKKKGVLSDEELDNVAGGELNWGNGQGRGLQDEMANVTFAFNVGDEVEVSQMVFWTERGVITDRKIESTIMPFRSGYEPIYYVRYFKRLDPSWVPQSYLSY